MSFPSKLETSVLALAFANHRSLSSLTHTFASYNIYQPSIVAFVARLVVVEFIELVELAGAF
jgi:hypothetical protein